MAIHPTAIVERGAELDSSVEVGPYAVIGPKVEKVKKVFQDRLKAAAAK